jgi:hypothetical protein
MKENTYGSRTLNRVGKVKLSIIMALVVILPIGALMVAVLRSEYSATTVQAQLRQEHTVDLVSNVNQELQNNNNNNDTNIDWEQVLNVLVDMGWLDELINAGLDMNNIQQLYYADISLANNQYNNDESITADGVQARFWSGTERYGWYAHNDKTGIGKLNMELAIWTALGVSAIIVAAQVAIAGILSAIFTLGLSAPLIWTLLGVVGGAIAFCWGHANKILQVMDTCLNKALDGQRYGFSRHYVFGITSGYDAW